MHSLSSPSLSDCGTHSQHQSLCSVAIDTCVRLCKHIGPMLFLSQSWASTCKLRPNTIASHYIAIFRRHQKGYVKVLCSQSCFARQRIRTHSNVDYAASIVERIYEEYFDLFLYLINPQATAPPNAGTILFFYRCCVQPSGEPRIDPSGAE